MEWTIVLPLGVFIALAALFVVVFHRAGRLVARSREVEGFRSAVRDLTGRIEVSLEGATARIDAVRRQQLGPDTIGETLVAATDAVRRYRDEARLLRGSSEAGAIRDDIVAELERAERALAMVDHGVGILAAVRRGGRGLEAQTSIKRGYLNLLHAREALRGHALRADGVGRDARSRRDLLRPSL
jgi:hypothetical protein